MSADRIVSTATVWGRRFAAGGIALTAIAWGTPGWAVDATLSATYYISLIGFTIGRVTADSHITDDSYSAVIDGSTYGISRIVSDSRAVLIGSGSIDGKKIRPATYSFMTSEGGDQTRVNMALADNAIVELMAEPELRDVPDRVPLTADDRRHVVDPVGAFMVSLAGETVADGESVCDRTVPVFDGWQRFDIKLTYKRTEIVTGRGDSYSGPVIVCGAQYVPVAGHRESRESIQYMAQNRRLEVWMAPVAHTTLLVPHRIIIGTKIGDLTIAARDFVVTVPERQASID